ncbi:GNAT family N-acetyltransferase [Neomegalonema sp.]|uniref:GNAT family N-acetyltransferase n=1 Tax=Neomegalonema sp. TaxID=2039713 RepID=UPI0026089928|nr:N-acetyltransferase [Neomegalonema sp.]MDD2867034.1 N-acetyltransferase [Neomegalonema sp.]
MNASSAASSLPVSSASSEAPLLDIRRETPEDLAEVEYLLDTCFAPGRTALSSYRLRDGVEPLREFCLVARDEQRSLVSCIRYWPVRVGEAGSAALLLGPVATHPTRQGEGLGAMLILRSLRMAREAGWTRVILVGDEPYYRKFGFARETALKISYPPPVNPARLLARELQPGAMAELSGMVRKWTPEAPA